MATIQQVTTSQEQPNFGGAYFSKDEQYDPYEQFQRRAYSEMLPQTGAVGTRPYQRLEAAAMRQFDPAFGQWLLSQPAQTGGFGGASYTSGFGENIPGAAPTFGAWYDARQPTGDPYQALQSLAALSGTYGQDALTEAEGAARIASPFSAYLDPSSREARAITSYTLGGPTRGYLGQLQQGRAQSLVDEFNRQRMQQGSSVYGMPAEMYFNWLQNVLPQGYGAGQEAAQGGTYTGTPGSTQGAGPMAGTYPTEEPNIPITYPTPAPTTLPISTTAAPFLGTYPTEEPNIPITYPTPTPTTLPTSTDQGFMEPWQRDQLLPVTAGAAAPTGDPYGGGIVDIPTSGVQPTPTPFQEYTDPYGGLTGMGTGSTMPTTRITPTPTITEAPTPTEEAPITALPRTEGEIYQTWQGGGDDLAAIDELVSIYSASDRTAEPRALQAKARETVARWAAIPGTGIGQTATPAPAPAPARVRGRVWADLTQEQQNILRAMESGYKVPLSRSPIGRMKAPAGASSSLFKSTNPNDWVQWAIKTGMPYTP